MASLQLEDLVDDMRAAMTAARSLIASPELEQAVARLNASLKNLDSLLEKADQQVNPLVASLRETSDTAKITLDEAKVTLASTQGLIGQNSQVRYDLTQLMQELSEAARSIRVLADYLEQNPNALLSGKGGDDR